MSNKAEPDLTLGEPRASEAPPQSDATRSASDQVPVQAAATERGLVRKGHAEPDPELWIRNKPNASHVITVLGRQVVQEVDAYGCRPVVGQPLSGKKILAVYGCSHTYGTALPAEETFCSLLQGMFREWRVENHGTGSYGTTQSLIQLQRNSRWGAADYITFCWIPSHLLRSVAEITWLQHLSKNLPRHRRVGKYPRAALDRDGNLVFRSVRFPRCDLVASDLSDFRPDPHYLDLVTAKIFRRAQEIATAAGAHFFVTVLAGQFSSVLYRELHAAGIPVANASVTGREYTCLPDDGHPNARANIIFAEKIRDYLVSKEAAVNADRNVG